MTGSRRSFIAATAAAGAGIAGFPAIVRAQQKTVWRAQSMWSAAESTYTAFEDCCARIGRARGGRLEVQPFAAGAVVGVFESLDAVQAGVLQAHSTAPVYFTGKDAGFAVLGDLCFGYQHPWQADAYYYYRGGLDLLREAYGRFNAHCVGVTWWGVESIVSKRPIKAMADFKGVKFRSPQGISAEILTKLGASIVVLPGGEVFSALDKGVVDAADWGTVSMNQRMGFHDIAKFPTMFTHSMPCQDFTVNAAAWRALPEPVQEWLRLQRHVSAVPPRDGLLVETFPRGGKFFLVAYGFEGKLAHQTLGMLVTKRMERLGMAPLGYLATDYVLATWSAFEPTGIERLFQEDLLGEELEEWMADSSMLRRSFRNIAMIAGLIEKNHPNEEKSRRQMTMSADLIYDVLRKHEPDHILLRATRREAAGGLTDVARIGLVLERARRGGILHRALDRVSPLAVPSLIEKGREWVAGGAEDALLAEAAALVEEATGGAESFGELLAEFTDHIPARGDRDRPRRPRDARLRAGASRFPMRAPKGLIAPR